MNKQLDIEKTTYNSASDYELRYKKGYGLVYPESHIIRIHKHILEWELNITTGSIFDFGCGSGAHLKYFADNNFIPYGCDTSETAIEKCRLMMPEFKNNFFVSEPFPNLPARISQSSLDIFVSNQVLYYFTDDDIRLVAGQAYKMLKSGGVFIATMMSYQCWYSKYICGNNGDFKIIRLNTPRQVLDSEINLKNSNELESLFPLFRKLHIGSYGNHVREEEGDTHHWIFVGIKK